MREARFWFGEGEGCDSREGKERKMGLDQLRFLEEYEPGVFKEPKNF